MRNLRAARKRTRAGQSLKSRLRRGGRLKCVTAEEKEEEEEEEKGNEDDKTE
jgi:hypothetical protein